MLTLTQSPVAEPVTLEQVKAHLGVDHNQDDNLIQMGISAAREYVERYTGRALVEATYLWTPGEYNFNCYLPRWPASVTRSYYVDDDGIEIDYDDWVIRRDGTVSYDRSDLSFELLTQPEWTTLPGQMTIAIFLLVESTYDADPEQQETLRDAALKMLDLYKTDLGF